MYGRDPIVIKGIGILEFPHEEIAKMCDFFFLFYFISLFGKLV